MSDKIPDVTDVDEKENTQVAVSDALEQVQTAFDDLTSVDRQTDINIQSSAGVSILRDVVNTTGSGAVTEDNANGEITVESGTTSASDAYIETGAYGQYVAGYIAQQGMGIRLPSLDLTGDQRIRWGYFNTENGFFWGYDADGLYVARLRNNTIVDKVYRDKWNVNDPDEIREDTSFDPTEGAIYHIDFAWYGYGVIEFSIISAESNNEQKTALVHRFSVDGETSISNPNQPIRVDVLNGSSTDNVQAKLGGRQFSIFGERNSDFRITSDDATGVSVANGAWTHLISFKREANDPRRANVEVDGLKAFTDGDTKLALVWDANISSTNYTDPDLIGADETTLLSSTAGTFDGIGDGRKIWSTVAAGGRNTSGNESLSGFDYSIPRETPVSIIAQGIGNSPTASATLRLREEW